MKVVILILTMICQLLLILELKLLDNFNLIVTLFLSVFVIGLLIKLTFKGKYTYAIGWGVLYGSSISMSLLFIFMAWLSNNFPK